MNKMFYKKLMMVLVAILCESSLVGVASLESPEDLVSAINTDQQQDADAIIASLDSINTIDAVSEFLRKYLVDVVERVDNDLLLQDRIKKAEEEFRKLIVRWQQLKAQVKSIEKRSLMGKKTR